MSSKNRRPQPKPPRLLARWQRLLLWAVWLFFVSLIAWHSDRGSMGCAEGTALIAATAVTVWCHLHPYGIVKVVIRKREELRGEFESRTSWPWVLFSLFAVLGGVAMTIRLTLDLVHGFTTWGGVFADIVDFFLQWFVESKSAGRHGDVTFTRLYILVILLPIGLWMVWYNARPLLNRGQPFQVNDAGSFLIQRGEMWSIVNVRNYAVVCADGVTIDFKDAEQASAALILPQWRVFSRERNTEVPRHVLASYFRHRLESNGFAVETRELKSVKLETSWIAHRMADPS